MLIAKLGDAESLLFLNFRTLLKIRLTRTGKKSQPSYRVVVAEHTAPIKSQFVEILGHYNLSLTPRLLEVNQERAAHWISKGAQPTDTVASLLKSLGMAGMEKYIAPRTLKRKSKKAPVEEAPKAKVVEATATVTEEATPAEEAPSVEAPMAEAASVEEAPVAEAGQAEETPAS